MKKNLMGYYKYSEEELNEIWHDCIFVFDACSILDLYRVSDKTRKAYFELLEKIKDKLWIPFNIAEEFARNKDIVMKEYVDEFNKIYKEFKVSDNYEEKLNILKNKILVSSEDFEQLKDDISDINKKLKKSIDKIRKNQFSNFDENKIEKNILRLFDNKVGEKLSDEDVKKYTEIGDKRYSKNIPPGYKDGAKSEIIRKYGDLINWMCILKYAKENSRNIIFITSERKSDWFELEGKKIIRARPELINEFNFETKKLLAIYRIDDFIDIAKEKLSISSIDKSVLKEFNQLDKEKNEEKKQVSLSNSRLSRNYINHAINNIDINKLDDKELMLYSNYINLLIALTDQEIKELHRKYNYDAQLYDKNEKMEMEVKHIQLTEKKNNLFELQNKIDHLLNYRDG